MSPACSSKDGVLPQITPQKRCDVGTRRRSRPLATDEGTKTVRGGSIAPTARRSTQWGASSSGPNRRPTVVMVVRRALGHLFRVNALQAMLLIAVSLSFVFGFGPSSTVGQTALVVIGVLVSYVILPSQQTPVWAIEGKDLSRTVPAGRLLDASRSISEALALQAQVERGATVEIEAIEKYWTSALSGLTVIIDNPARLLIGMQYRSTVTFRGLDPPIVRTTIAANRCIPNAIGGRVWFSFCSDPASLSAEFDEQDNGCLGREIVEPYPTETFDSWRRRIESYSVRLIVNGQPIMPLEVSGDSKFERQRFFEEDSSFCLRIPFKSEELTLEYVPVSLAVEFEGPQAMYSFPCKFTSYWVVGAAQISFELEGSDARVEIDEYISASARNVTVRPTEGLLTRGWQIEAGTESVLPPGTGAVFTWHPRRVQVLARPPIELLERIEPGAPLPELGEAPLVRQPCEGRRSVLVDVTEVDVLDVYAMLGVLPPRPARCRSEVARALSKANEHLPEGLSIVVLDAYRTKAEQSSLLAHYARLGPTEGFVASVDETNARAPHTTGGAVDVTLGFQGRRLALGTDFDSFLPDAAYGAYEQVDSVVRRLRRALASALSKEGFVGHPLEWWHWSLGEDWWAASKKCPALFEVVEDEADA